MSPENEIRPMHLDRVYPAAHGPRATGQGSCEAARARRPGSAPDQPTRFSSTAGYRRKQIRRALMVSDGTALSLGLVVAWLAGACPSASTTLQSATFALVILCSPVLFGAYGLYARDEEHVSHTTADDLVPIVHVMLILTWIVALALWLGNRNVELEGLFAFLSSSVALAVAGRAIARAWRRRGGGYVQNTLVVGAGSLGQLLAARLARRLHVHGLHVVGFVDDDPPDLGSQGVHAPVLGRVEDLHRLIGDFDVERVIVAFSLHSHERTQRLLRSLKGIEVQIDIVPRLFEVLGPNSDIHTIDGLPLIGHPRRHQSRARERVKRTVDVVLATVGLLACTPMLALIALLVRLGSDGPAIYSAERIGRGGRSFRQLKFRTMHARLCDGPRYGGDDAETAFVALLAENEALREQYERVHKLDPDPRVTAVGRFLRTTSLDELPQLWNVIRGDLSLVGPRPITAAELPRYGEQASELLSIRPGLTGYWQISGRSALGYEERVRLDLAYVKSWSLKLDMQILLRTTTLFTGRGGAV